MIDAIINADKVSTCINKVQICFRYTDTYKGSPNCRIIETSIQEAFRGWEKDDPWLRFLREGLFRFNDQSFTAGTELKLTFEKDRLNLTVSNANIHYNYLPSVIYMFLYRHQSNAQMLEELAEHGTDMSQFPTFENSEDRIKSIEISGIKGTGAPVPMETVKELRFIARNNIHLHHNPSEVPQGPDDSVADLSMRLTGFDDFSPPELNPQIELFEDAESNGFFIGKEYKNPNNDSFLETFWSTDQGEPVLQIDDLNSQYYSALELLNVLNYDHHNTIKMEII